MDQLTSMDFVKFYIRMHRGTPSGGHYRLSNKCKKKNPIKDTNALCHMCEAERILRMNGETI